MNPIISREQAAARGLKLFFTGRPCRNGHVTDRYVSCGLCRDCNRQYSKNRYEKVRGTRTLGNIAAARGLVLVNLMVHPDDEAELRALALAQRLMRGLPPQEQAATMARPPYVVAIQPPRVVLPEPTTRNHWPDHDPR